jgi:uncharacterized protein (TIGR02300 family)
MPELKLGTKFECYSCGTKFYDLGKSEPLCPKCGANQKDATSSDAPSASQASRRRRKAEVVGKAPIEVEDEEPIVDVDEEIVPDADLEGAALDDDEEEEEDFDDEE